MAEKKKGVNKKFLSLVVFVLLIAITIYVIISQSRSFTVEGFFAYIRSANPYWLSAACLCMLMNIVCEGASILTICRALGYPRSAPKGILYSAADIYFSAITPSATGGQPASAYFMMQDGIPGVVTTTALLINLSLCSVSIIVLGVLCFILCPAAFLSFGTAWQILIIIGALIQILLFIGYLLLIFKENYLLKIFDFGMRILHKLHIRNTLGDRKAKIEAMRADYRASAGNIRHEWRRITLGFILNLLQRASLLLIPVFVLLAEGGSPANCALAFATQGMISLGATYVPVPGAVGISDALFFDGFAELTNNVTFLELLSRGVSFYISILLCGLIVLVAYIVRRRKKDA